MKCTNSSGAWFRVGDTTVTCSFDLYSPTPCTFLVQVRDTTSPTVTVPTAPISVEATDPSGTIVNFPPVSAYDIYDGAMSPDCVPASGSAFVGVGTFPVTCSATDRSNNTGSGTFNVTVTDTTAPTLHLPDSIVSDTAIVSWANPTATDNSDINVVVLCDATPGSRFLLGSTDVQCSATDMSGNSATGTFTITVIDRTAPVLTLPASMIVEAANSSGKQVQYATPQAIDDFDGQVPVLCSPTSGSMFPIGTTTIDCEAADLAGNNVTGSFSITVSDTTEPILQPPAGMQVEATSAEGSIITFAATGYDAVSGIVTVTCTPTSGNIFPMGNTAINCTASDNAGNPAAATFNVYVVDTTVPVMQLPETQSATSAAGSIVTYTATGFDILDGIVTVTCMPESGSVFSIGTTTINCTATDKAGNTAAATFDVYVVDTTAPALQLPETQTVEATSAAGSTVTYTASGVDLVDGQVVTTCTPTSGSVFALGTTVVSCASCDRAGNTAYGIFTVNVVDTTAPDMHLPLPNPMAVTATGPDGAVAVYTVSATDKVSGNTPVTCASASGSVFKIGRNTVSCNTKDKAGNTKTASFDITVRRCPSGFLSPLDTTALKSVSSTQTLPIKFSLGGYYGMDVIASQHPMLTQVQCDSLSTTVQDIADTTSVGSLSYDASSTTYTLPFSLKGAVMKGACYRLRLMLTTCLDIPYDVMIQVKS